jgi:ubiquitin C-terminal hydrolase
MRVRAAVALDEIIDFGKYMDVTAPPAQSKYKLRAITVHQGHIVGGHYFMYILHAGQW